MQLNLYKVKFTTKNGAEVVDFVVAKNMGELEDFYAEFDRKITVTQIAHNEDYSLEHNAQNFLVVGDLNSDED